MAVKVSLCKQRPAAASGALDPRRRFCERVTVQSSTPRVVLVVCLDTGWGASRHHPLRRGWSSRCAVQLRRRVTWKRRGRCEVTTSRRRSAASSELTFSLVITPGQLASRHHSDRSSERKIKMQLQRTELQPVSQRQAAKKLRCDSFDWQIRDSARR